eukprot:CAMPEP_0119433704 /NCGR_PEP_ID=MMETSP1335-20130426/50057_1 /TAXON_ID=259385 /ORGANISM="Chrysoculter rhomboideus, Strain RCC1486" /LENGTH=144 /DNA_ID=CAMNT_0007459549 /DNA_START=103 /DNA_END=537 /DNA_ORIENTATION=-
MLLFAGFEKKPTATKRVWSVKGRLVSDTQNHDRSHTVTALPGQLNPSAATPASYNKPPTLPMMAPSKDGILERIPLPRDMVAPPERGLQPRRRRVPPAMQPRRAQSAPRAPAPAHGTATLAGVPTAAIRARTHDKRLPPRPSPR